LKTSQQLPTRKLSHIDEKGNPVMVNVADKNSTQRKAVAEARVRLPKEVMSLIKNDELKLAKGPVFSTAIIAGIMGAKKTSNLIPLCHPLAVSAINIEIEIKKNSILVKCEASITGQTGVEMEALTGASVAALTIYDMCKAISHDIVIEEIRLIEKSGGKSDFKRK
jgi:cyclic pyranopterin monophosphate synthase